MKLTNIYYLFLFIFIVSCSSGEIDNSLYKDKSLNIHLNSPWKKIASEQSDYAFINSQTKSIIVINSICKKHQQNSLKQLTFNLLGGLSNLAIEDSVKSRFKNRDLLITNAQGSLDGIDVYMTIKSFQKNRCLYDYLLISNSINLRNKDQRYLKEVMNK